MSGDHHRKYYYAVFALVLGALIVPLWLVEVPPLVDLPNHLARVFVLANYADTPFFQENFQIVYEPIPNLAIDLIVAPLTKIFDVRTANHLFLTLMVVLFALGCHLIGGQKSRSRSFSAIPAAFLIYSGTFFYGYVNYVFGIALFLVTFGLWLRWRGKLSFKYLLPLVGLAFAVFLSHLSAFVFFGIAVIFANVYDFFIDPAARRRWTLIAADSTLFLLPAISFLAFMSSGGNVGVVRWNSLSGKAIALFGAFRSYDLWLDLLCAATLAAVLFWLKRRGQMTCDRRILSLALLFLLIFLLAPNIFFTGDADVRIVLPAFALLILSCRFNNLSGKSIALFTVLICLFSVRQGVISYRWIQISEKMTAETNLLDVIAPQSKIYPIFVGDGDDPDEKTARPMVHAVHYATLKNSSFAPSLFAFRGQQPLIFRQGGEYATLENKDQTKWLQNLAGSDYVWTYNAPQTVLDELEKRGTIVAESEKTRIWKLNK